MCAKVKLQVKGVGGRKPRKRARICVLLGSGLYASKVAELLEVSEAYVSTQARLLVKDNALVPGARGREQFYTKGPNFDKYEELSSTDTWGVESPSPSNRFHHLSATCEIQNASAIDLSAITWDKSWHPRPEQTYRKLVLKALAATVIVHDKVSLNIWIHDVEEVPEDPKALDEAYTNIQQRFYDVWRHLSKQCGFVLTLPEMNREIHIAQELPELKGLKTGHIPLDEEGTEFIDDSLGKRPEHEVTRIEKAKQRATAYKLIPDFMERLAEYIASNNRREKHDEEVIETVLKVATEQGERHNELLKRLDQLLKKLTPTESEYIPPIDPKNEDKQPPGYL